MPITPTYPGVYVEELPSVSHSVTPAPTSVTAFVGYTHPLKTTTFGQAVQLFSFADYQANFGGFFSHPLLPDYVGQAVSQFFLNGGSTAWVVGLASNYYAIPTTAGTAPAAQGAVVGATATIGAKTSGQLVFTAREPTALTGSSTGIQMTLTFSNLRQTANANDTADITIVYGTTTESYRRVTIGNLVTALAGSALVTVAASGPMTAYPTAVTPGTPVTFAYATAVNSQWTVINPLDFGPVFQANSSLDKVSVINLVAMPGITGTGALTVLSDAVEFCERKLAFLIIDPPPYAVADSTESKDTTAAALAGAAGLLAATSPANPDTIDDMLSGGTFFPQSPNCALYFPWIQTADPVTGQQAQSPPSGFVAGMFAQEDASNGVWKSPAGLETALLGTPGVVPWGRMTDPRQGALNPVGINCLRQFPGVGTVIYGASTLVRGNTGFQQYWYVSVRRTALFIEQSLSAALKWAVFAPNDQQLWTALRLEVQAFMLSLFLQGAFPGSTPDQAFQVQCDSTTTTPTDIANGTVNIVVSFAPLKPAEFVVIKIAQLAGQS
jgi:phage tail sheath protein FI